MTHVALASAKTAIQAAPCGFLHGTSVVTLDGELPVEFLEVGDRIVTRTGVQRLKAITVAQASDLTMVRLGASTLGHEQPQDDLLVPAAQLVLVRDWRAMALAGTAQALIAASRLIDGEYIRTEVLAQARLYNLEFDEEVVIYAGGLELVCGPALVAA